MTRLIKYLWNRYFVGENQTDYLVDTLRDYGCSYLKSVKIVETQIGWAYK